MTVYLYTPGMDRLSITLDAVADLTDEQIDHAGKGARQMLADAAMDADKFVDAKALTGLVHRVAECDAEAVILHQVRYMLVESEATHAEIRAHLTDVLVRGADDTWSGRGNDTTRAAFDHTRFVIRRLLDAMDRADRKANA